MPWTVKARARTLVLQSLVAAAGSTTKASRAASRLSVDRRDLVFLRATLPNPHIGGFVGPHPPPHPRQPPSVVCASPSHGNATANVSSCVSLGVRRFSVAPAAGSRVACGSAERPPPPPPPRVLDFKNGWTIEDSGRRFDVRVGARGLPEGHCGCVVVLADEVARHVRGEPICENCAARMDAWEVCRADVRSGGVGGAHLAVAPTRSPAITTEVTATGMFSYES